MSRSIALFAAFLLTTLIVSTACLAGVADGVNFTIQPSRSPDQVHISFSSAGGGNSRWSSPFAARDLSGLDVTRLRSSASQPIRFQITREAGRLDCTGKGGERRGVGSCRFTADPSFTAFLVSRGIGRPNADQAFSLMAVNARRSVVTALSDARYPRPTVNNLIPLVAIGVDSRYIAGLADAGYGPANLDSLLQFKALGMSPAFIRSFRGLGYDNLRPAELVQLKALGIDGAYIADLNRLGYRKLPVADLVQLKALGVTPEFVLELRRRGYRDLTVSKLVQIKALGLAPDGARRADRNNRAR